MRTVQREIRTYVCAKCKARIMDHAEIGGRFADSVRCPKCRGVMTHSTATYDIVTHDESKPHQRVATKVGA